MDNNVTNLRELVPAGLAAELPAAAAAAMWVRRHVRGAARHGPRVRRRLQPQMEMVKYQDLR